MTDYKKQRKIIEAAASVGMLAIAAALLIPLMAQILDPAKLNPYKWLYTAGALTFTVARVVGARDEHGSLRLRRLRRLEFWAGVAFIAGAAFWFYNEGKPQNMGILAVLKDTISFSMAGGVLQIIAAWMISFREAKEAREAQEATGKEKAKGKSKKSDEGRR